MLVAIAAATITPLLVVLHELAHAAAAWAVGMPVLDLEFGTVPGGTYHRIGRVTVGAGLQLWRGGGHCCVGEAARLSTFRVAMFLAAPLLMHGLLLTWAALRLADDAPPLAWVVVIANVSMLVVCVLPNAGAQITDGAWLWALFRDRAGTLQRFRSSARVNELWFLQERGQWEQLEERARSRVAAGDADECERAVLAIALFHRGAADEAMSYRDDFDACARRAEPNLVPLRVSLDYVNGAWHAEHGRFDEAERIFEEAAAAETDEAHVLHFEVCAEFARLLRDPSVDRTETTGRAYEHLPWDFDVECTHGAALVAAGRDVEGLPLLDRWADAPSTYQAFRALGHARLGHSRRARAAWECAREQMPATLLARFEKAWIDSGAPGHPGST